jgi:hypothetical protein
MQSLVLPKNKRSSSSQPFSAGQRTQVAKSQNMRATVEYLGWLVDVVCFCHLSRLPMGPLGRNLWSHQGKLSTRLVTVELLPSLQVSQLPGPALHLPVGPISVSNRARAQAKTCGLQRFNTLLLVCFLSSSHNVGGDYGGKPNEGLQGAAKPA